MDEKRKIIIVKRKPKKLEADNIYFIPLSSNNCIRVISAKEFRCPPSVEDIRNGGYFRKDAKYKLISKESVGKLAEKLRELNANQITGKPLIDYSSYFSK